VTARDAGASSCSAVLSDDQALVRERLDLRQDASRQHAASSARQRATVEDLGSRNGTFRTATARVTQPLKSGDRITVGA
jgi:pSer/pThr/pTyr-binding forkhead associated (FHA) protein